MKHKRISRSWKMTVGGNWIFQLFNKFFRIISFEWCPFLQNFKWRFHAFVNRFLRREPWKWEKFKWKNVFILKLNWVIKIIFHHPNQKKAWPNVRRSPPTDLLTPKNVHTVTGESSVCFQLICRIAVSNLTLNNPLTCSSHCEWNICKFAQLSKGRLKLLCMWKRFYFIWLEASE